MSFDSLEFFKTLYPIRLSSFETRKIIFDKEVVNQDMRTGIQLAVNFELAYLENKRDYYQNVASEDLKRIDMLKKRINL